MKIHITVNTRDRLGYEDSFEQSDIISGTIDDYLRRLKRNIPNITSVVIVVNMDEVVL